METPEVSENLKLKHTKDEMEPFESQKERQKMPIIEEQMMPISANDVNICGQQPALNDRQESDRDDDVVQYPKTRPPQSEVNDKSSGKSHKYTRSRGNYESSEKSVKRIIGVMHIKESENINQLQVISSPCSSYIACSLAVDIGNLSATRCKKEMAACMVYNSDDLQLITEFRNFTCVSFVPKTSVLVGLLIDGDSNEQYRMAAYDFQAGMWLCKRSPGQADGNIEKKLTEGIAYREMADEHKTTLHFTNFACYISISTLLKKERTSPLLDCAAVLFGYQSAKNCKLDAWRGIMIYYHGISAQYGEQNTWGGSRGRMIYYHGKSADKMQSLKDDMRLELADQEVRMAASSFAEFDNDADLKLTLIDGGRQLVVVGHLAGSLNVGVVVYAVDFSHSTSQRSYLEIACVKVGKIRELPDECALKKTTKVFRYHFAAKVDDPMMTTAAHVPSLVVNHNDRVFVVDFSLDTPAVVLQDKDTEFEEGKYRCFGSQSECMVSATSEYNRSDYIIKIWIKPKKQIDNRQFVYIKEVKEINRGTIQSFHLTPDLNKIVIHYYREEGILNCTKYQNYISAYYLDLAVKPELTIKISANKNKNIKYLTDGQRELIVDDHQAIYTDLSIMDRYQRTTRRPLADIFGIEIKEYRLHSVSSTADFRAFYLMFIMYRSTEGKQAYSIRIVKMNDQLQKLEYCFVQQCEGRWPELAQVCGPFAVLPFEGDNYHLVILEGHGNNELEMNHSPLPLDIQFQKLLECRLVGDFLVALIGEDMHFVQSNGQWEKSNMRDHTDLSSRENTNTSFRFSNNSGLIFRDRYVDTLRVITLARNNNGYSGCEIMEHVEKTRQLKSQLALSPSGQQIAYFDKDNNLMLRTIADSPYRRRHDRYNDGYYNDYRIAQLDARSFVDLRFTYQKAERKNGLSFNLAAVYADHDDNMHADVMALDTKSWLHRIVVQSPLVTHDLIDSFFKSAKSCSYFDKDRFEVKYFDERYGEEMSIRYPSDQYSIPSWIDQTKNRILRNDIEGIASLLCMVHPNSHPYDEGITTAILKLNSVDYLETYLQHVQHSMLFSDPEVIEACFEGKLSNQMREVIFDALKTLCSSDQLVDSQAIFDYLSRDLSSLMTNQFSRDMFVLLMQAKIEGEIICALDKNFRTFPLAVAIKDEDFIFLGEIDMLKRKIEKQSQGEYLQTYEIHRSLTKLDLSSGSHACTNLFLTMSKLTDEAIETTMLPMIYYKWSVIRRFGFLFSFLYWVMAILAYTFFGYYSDLLGLGVVVCILNVLFFCYEVKCAVSLGLKTHLKNPWNWVDLLILGFSFSCVVSCLASPSKINDSNMVWLRIFAASAIWTRAITWLRVFGPTRYLITMVLQVFIDMVPFLIVFLTAIVAYAYIWRLSPLLEDPLPQSSLEPSSFYESLYVPVMLIFGNGLTGEQVGDGEEKFSIIRFVINAIGNLVLSLTFLNFLIAVISGTYEKVNEKKDLHDVRELLGMIIEFNAFLEKIVRKNTKPTYFITLHPKQKTEEGLTVLEQKMDKLGEEHIKRFAEIDANFKNMDKKFENMDMKFENIIDKKFENMDKQMKTLFEGISIQIQNSIRPSS